MGIVTGLLTELLAQGAPTGAVASDGVNIPINSLAQTLAYTGGNLTSITVTYNAVNYVQTLTYTAGVLTAVSAWVAT